MEILIVGIISLIQLIYILFVIPKRVDKIQHDVKTINAKCDILSNNQQLIDKKVSKLK
jgi:outer membrane murein-binding lipoprotein Lpp